MLFPIPQKKQKKKQKKKKKRASELGSVTLLGYLSNGQNLEEVTGGEGNS